MRGRPLEWRTFWLALLTVTCLSAAFWFVAPPRYDTNDDVAIRARLEGFSVPGQPPTGFVVLSHAALGWTLVTLRRVAPTMPWWDLVVSATLLWSITVLVAIAWNALGRDWLSRSSALIVVLVATAPLVVALQYTISATLAGGTALLLVASELGSAPPLRLSGIVMGLLMAIVATLLRPMGAVAGAASAAILLVPAAVISGSRAMRGLAIAAVTAVLIYGAATATDSWLYRFDRPWQQYAEYNDMLARLFEWGGNLTGEQTAAMRKAAGWSKNDWDMLPAMWGVDPDVHGFARLRRAYDVSTTVAPGMLTTLRDVAVRAVGIARLDSGPLLAESGYVIGGALFLMLFATRGRGFAVGALLVVLFLVTCVAIEAAFKTLPFRVIAPIEACLAGAIVITAATWGPQTSPVARVIAVGLLLAVFAQESIGLAAAVAAGKRNIEQVDQEVAALRDLRPSLIVLHADTFPAEIWWRPFHRPPFALPAVAFGWNDQSPSLQQFLTAAGRQPLLRTMCGDPSIVTVARNEETLEPVGIYLQEHFGQRVSWSRVNAGSFATWRCAPQDGSADVRPTAVREQP